MMTLKKNVILRSPLSGSLVGRTAHLQALMTHHLRFSVRFTRLLVLCVALSVVFCPAWAAEPRFPPLTGRVVDDATILSAATEEKLTGMLAAHEQATGEQVVVVTLASLQGWPIEDFGYRLGRAWGIGEKGKNTGALLIIAPKERTVRIEVGYGLEGKLTDALSRAIIERDLVPAFRQGDFDRGVLAGTAALLGALGGDPKAIAVPAERSQQDDPLAALFLLVLIFFVVFAVFGRRGHRVGPVVGGLWSAGGRSSSGSFGGGFSGGGGSFGGGGASGRW